MVAGSICARPGVARLRPAGAGAVLIRTAGLRAAEVAGFRGLAPPGHSSDRIDPPFGGRRLTCSS